MLNLRRVVSLRGLDVVNLRFDAFSLDETVAAKAFRAERKGVEARWDGKPVHIELHRLMICHSSQEHREDSDV